MKILLIEDDPAAANLFSALVFEGITKDIVTVDSVSATSGVMADVIVLDLRVRPEFDSMATINKISSMRSPVIALTNDPRPELGRLALAAGARYFFRKIEVIQNPSLLREAINSITENPQPKP